MIAEPSEPLRFDGGPLDPNDEGTDMSAWGYWVAFDPDVAGALQRLRRAVFASGRYVLRGVIGFGPDFAALDGKWREEAPGEAEDLDEAGEGWDGTVPASMEDLLEMSESGTRTVIDMIGGLSTHREFMAVSPLTDDEIERLFGTTRPTRAQIEARRFDILGLRIGWDGAYVTAYDADGPAFLYFVGSSGES